MRKLWAALSGKKRTIAALYWGIVLPSMPIVWPDGVPENINKIAVITGLVLTYMGLGHAAIKKYVGGTE